MGKLLFTAGLLCALTMLFCGCASLRSCKCDGESGKISAKDGYLLLDVRTPEEYAASHLQGAVNLPYDNIESCRDRLPENDTRIELYCRSGRRSAIAAETLRRLGFASVKDLGGMPEAAKVTGIPVVK